MHHQVQSVWISELKRILPFLLLAAVVAGFFSPVWLRGQRCAPLDIPLNLYEPWADVSRPVEVHNHFVTDAPQQYFPYMEHAAQSFKREGQWGWNYLKNCGTRSYANTMAVPFSWRLQLFRFLPFWAAWHLAVFGQLLIASTGMFVFLRSMGYRDSFAFAGAVAFGFCAHFSVWLYHLWAGGLCFLPWACWAFQRWRNGFRRGLLAPVFVALGFLGAHLQYAAFWVIAIGCLWLGWTWEDVRDRRSFDLRRLGFFMLAGIIALGLAAIMFVPCVLAFFDTLAYGLVRGSEAYPRGVFLSPILNMLAWPFFVFPQALGSPHSFDISKLFGINLMYVPFFGSLLVILAFGGLFVRKLNPTAKVFVLAGLLLPLTPLVGPLYHRLHFFFTFGGIWLAIDLIDKLSSIHWRLFWKRLAMLYLVVSLGLLVLAVVLELFESALFEQLWASIQPSVQEHLFAVRPKWFEQRLKLFIYELNPFRPYILLPWLLFGASILLMKFRGKAFFGWGLALLIMTQLWVYDKNWIVFHEPLHDGQEVYAMTEEIRVVQEEVGITGRVLVAQRADRLPLFPLNSLSSFGIPCVVGYDSILPNGMQKGVPYSPIIGVDLPEAEMLGRKGVTHLITFADDQHPGEGWKLLCTAGKVAIYENIFAVAWYRVRMSDGRIMAVNPLEHRHNSRTLRLPKSAESVFLCENWDEGWQYRINDEKWEYMELNNDRSMSASFAPLVAESSFEMRYKPRALRVGKAISFAFVGLYVSGVTLLLKKRKQK
jgi:hypothetical protein